MFYDNALSLAKQNLTISLATATVCLLNSSQAAAVEFDTQVKTNQASFSESNLDHIESHSFHDCQQDCESGMLSRILTLFAAPFWNQIANVVQADQPIEQNTQVNGMGGSFKRDLNSVYLSQVNSSLTKDFKLAAIDKINSSATKSQLITYTIKAGDTLNSIAKKHQVSRQELIKLNNINNSNIIFVDRQLTIPVATSDKIPHSENITFATTPIPSNSVVNKNLSSASSIQIADAKVNKTANNSLTGDRLKLDINQKKMITSAAPQSPQDLNSISEEAISLELPPLPPSDEYLPNAFEGYAWPAQGVLTSGYGWRWGRLHKGIDIAGPVGTPVLAAASGEVISAGWNSGGYGNLIKLKHLDGSTTIYAHNHRIMVSQGQKVNQGDQIAEMGNTGFSTGSHLHFEIHSREQGIVNPLALLN